MVTIEIHTEKQVDKITMLPINKAEQFQVEDPDLETGLYQFLVDQANRRLEENGND